LDRFINHLSEVTEATKTQKTKELWDVQGVITKKSNQIFKFDTRPLKKIKGQVGKEGSFKSKADKIVFESIDSWIIVDVDELHEFLKEKQQKIISLDDLISELSWNIILPKK
jgi:hypothetical protein|tara:strand:- start:45 stop:380 length:336 start_codon:yes stop_codon:yes gene_type:complete